MRPEIWINEQKEEKKDGSCNYMDDRLSELPRPLLHRILCFLSQKQAIQTCVLSKTWRYLGSTRPKIDLCAICDKCLQLGETNNSCESCFGGNEKTFLSVLGKTLQRYRDQKLFTQEFCLKMLKVDPESISLLEKWIPLLITPYLAVNKFDIRFCHHKMLDLEYFDLPLEVFHIKSLKTLYLDGCKIDFVDKVIQLNRLQTLSLYYVLIADDTLEKIISSCPLIENVTLDRCKGFTTVKMINKHPNLKHFCLTSNYDCRGVEIDAPALETINIQSCRTWYLHNKYLHNLKSLHLYCVHLSSEFFENFSAKFPYLEKLHMNYCIHFDEFHLSSRSIKHLTLWNWRKSTKATIDTPNILYFEIMGYFAPSKLSFTKIPSECESHVDMSYTIEDSGYDVLQWFINLYELLRALGQSQITLQTSHNWWKDHETIGGFNEPILVEHLCLSLGDFYFSIYSLPDFISGLFRICRPRYADAEYECDIQLIGFLCTVLVEERDKGVYHWQQDLEDVEMEFWDNNAKEWNPTTLEEFKLLNKEKIRFRLKWKD